MSWPAIVLASLAVGFLAAIAAVHLARTIGRGPGDGRRLARLVLEAIRDRRVTALERDRLHRAAIETLRADDGEPVRIAGSAEP